MIKTVSLLGLLGLLVATGLLVSTGLSQIAAALAQAGWEGILVTSFSHLIPLFACVMGWQALLPGRGRQRAGHADFSYFLWIRASVNNLLPAARVGGEIVAVRLMVKSGISKAAAVAATVVEFSLSALAQFFFVLAGVVFFLLHVSHDSASLQLLLGLVIAAPLLAAMMYIQKVGLFGLLDRLFRVMLRDKWKSYMGSAARLDRAVRVMYRRRRKVVYCFVMQFCSWLLGTGEIWLSLYYLQQPLPLSQCMMIEAIIQATSAAAFLVPGALGVQEASFLLFCPMLGLAPETAAAMAVMRRCRDLVLYIPGLLAWQIQEGRWLVRKNAGSPR